MSDKDLVATEGTTPSVMLQDGVEMAKTLQSVVSKRKGGLVVNGKRYLQYEDWQTLARFFNLSVRTGNVETVEMNGVRGVKARAEVVDKNGNVVGSAEAFCMSDESKWSGKPFFQLASMAQTRAGAKSLRNLLGWVAVLAGFAGTPAEEMDDVVPRKRTSYKKSDDGEFHYKDPKAPCTEKQVKAINASASANHIDSKTLHKYLKNVYGVEHIKDLKIKEAGDIITILREDVPMILENAQDIVDGE